MDPLSALVLAGILTALVSRTVGSAVTDAIAQSRGQTPPSLEKWRTRQEARAARGEAPEKEPTPWVRRWRNAVEHRNARAAQRHAARMELLRDNGRDNVDRHKDKLIRRAARWNRIGALVAGMGNSSWDAAKNAAAAVKERREENQAWKENERRTAEQDQTADPESAANPAPDQSGDVLLFRRPNTDPADDGDPAAEPDTPAKEDNAEPSEQDNDNTTDDPINPDGGNTPMTSPANTATEITDLDTAIGFSKDTAKYTDTVSATLSDILAQLQTAVQGLNAEAAAYEQGKANLADGGGFKQGKITGKFDVASETLHAAAAACKAAAEKVSSASEHVTTAGGEMRSVNKMFGDQQAISENVGAHQDAGVSKHTAFYSGV